MSALRTEMLAVLPKYKDNRELIEPEQTTRDIVKEVLKAHEVYARHYDKIADLWMTGDLSKVPKRLYNFCKKELVYKEEPKSNQTTQSPATILTLRKVDCKHLSGFIGGVLDAINRTGEYYYDWCYRFASEKLYKPSPHHVFIVIKTDDDDVWIDAIEAVDSYDDRPFYFYHWDKKPKTMALTRISGRDGGFTNVTTARREKLFQTPAGSTAIGKIQAASPLGSYRGSGIGATGDIELPVPSNYPTNAPRPVLTYDGKLVLRGNKRILTPDEKKVIQATLQPIIIKYSKTPYNIYWSISGWGSGYADVQTATSPGTAWLYSQQEKDFLLYPRMPSGFDKFVMGLNDIVPSLVGLLANTVAPGTGGAAASIVASETAPAGGNTKVALTPQQLAAATTPTPAPTGTMTNVITLIKQNPLPALLIGAGVGYGLYKLFK